MADEHEHPFKPGVQVVVVTYARFNDERSYQLDTVLKLHSSGRFTLKSDPKQQWRACRGWSVETRLQYGDFEAHKTGDQMRYGGDHSTVYLMSPAIKKEIADARARHKRKIRMRDLRSLFVDENVDDITDEQLDGIEKILGEFFSD